MAMRRLAVAIMLTACPTIAYAAEPTPKPAKKSADQQSRQKSCAEYGAGFKRVEGSNSCVKIGGYVRFQSGVR